MNKILKIIYDASILAEGDQTSSTRSGIFFTALNILKQLSLNTDVDISIYCSNKNYSYKLTKTLEKYFPENDFSTLYLNILTPLELEKSKLVYHYKNKKNIFTKIELLLISTLIKVLPKNKNEYDKLLKDYDIYFSPVYKIPEEINKMKSIKKFTLLHDVIPVLYPEYFNQKDMKKYWFNQMSVQLNENDFYFTNSENTKNDFLKHFSKLNPSHITTAHLACSENFKPSKESTLKSLTKYNLPTDKRYIFSLCTLEPRKNLIRATKCFIKFIEKNNINDMVYILGGGQWDGFVERMEKEIPDFDKYRNVILKAGYIDDEDLTPLYSGAEWFVYTSEYEGFGLPPLEAMSCGCPVITSDRTSLPEVIGDAGIMIKYDSDDEHIKAYEKYYYNESIRQEYANKGLKRAKEFSWEKCAATMVKCMKKISFSTQEFLNK